VQRPPKAQVRFFRTARSLDLIGYNVMYGSIGASIALLVWMYLLAAIALIGCEFNAEYERIEAE